MTAHNKLSEPPTGVAPNLESGEQVRSRFQIFPKDSREYKRDLKKRKGGLTLSDSRNTGEVNSVTKNILNGSMSIEDAQAVIHRNPKVAHVWQAALNRRQQTQQILQGAATPQLGPQLGSGLLQQGAQETERFDPQAAISEAQGLGRFDLVKQLQGSLPRRQQVKLVKVDSKDSKGRTVTLLVDPNTRKVVRSFLKSAKDLSTKQKEILTDAARKFETSTRSIKTFRPEFANTGFKTLGVLEIELAKRKNDPASLRKLSWWQNFDLGEGLTRKALFGSQIPEGEMKQWEKLTLTPDMSAAQIANRLRQRRAIEFKWLTKQARVAIKGSRANQQQIDAALGENAKAIRTGKLPPLGRKSKTKRKIREPSGVVDFGDMPSRGR